MKKITYLFAMLLSSLMTLSIHPERITAIFFDIETIFYTDSMRASSYVGKIDSLRYLSQVGHLPSQEDLFKHLKAVKALSTQITYNKNLTMPLIFSDWLATAQSATKLKETIQRYFSNQNISDIEKKVLFAVVSMMMTPQHLADTQKISSKIEHLLEKLKSQGIKIYLVGNWAHISSLKSEFESIFQLFTGVYVSGDLHLLKPSVEFYQTVLSRSGVKSAQSLWVEAEPKFATQARQHDLNVVVYNNNHTELVQALQKYGISA